MKNPLKPGQALLEKDVTELLTEIRAGEFDDFDNMKYALPKVALRNKLIQLARNVEGGRYD